jgi:hypothetical protein
MAWVTLGRIALRLVSTAVGLTEASGTSFKGADKLKLAMGMVGDLASQCQELSPQQMVVMTNPQVQVAMQAYAKARVDLENAIARVSGAHS